MVGLEFLFGGGAWMGNRWAGCGNDIYRYNVNTIISVIQTSSKSY